jgi:hypothetical protein
LVNTQLLDEKIEKSGLKYTYIYDTLGISRQAFLKKRNNQIPFRGAEIFTLCALLNVKDDSEKMEIFFADNV